MTTLSILSPFERVLWLTLGYGVFIAAWIFICCAGWELIRSHIAESSEQVRMPSAKVAWRDLGELRKAGL